MTTTKKEERVEVAFTLYVDVKAWGEEYGMEEGQVAVDAASYFRNVLHELRVVRDGLATIREDDAEPPRGADSAEDGLLVPADRLQGLWDELREMYAVLVRTPAPRELSMGLGWACLAYSRIVGIPLERVQNYLQLGQVNAPTEPWDAAMQALHPMTTNE